MQVHYETGDVTPHSRQICIDFAQIFADSRRIRESSRRIRDAFATDSGKFEASSRRIPLRNPDPGPRSI
eukprot:5435309-Prymnesium_polylepis.1